MRLHISARAQPRDYSAEIEPVAEDYATVTAAVP